MKELNLPRTALRLREHDGITQVWDTLREKYVALTPEENVRQHFTAWMRERFAYPAHMMANEHGITVNGTHKRCDTVVFGRDGKPLVVVEYKAPDVAVTQDVFEQVVRYNMVLHARYIIVSNGINHYCCAMDYASGTYHFLPVIPDYPSIVAPPPSEN